MVKKMLLVYVLGLILASFAFQGVEASVGSGGIVVTGLDGSLVYGPGDFDACGVNYVIITNRTIDDLLSNGDNVYGNTVPGYENLSTTLYPLESYFRDALDGANLSARVTATVALVDGSWKPVLMVSVPEPVDLEVLLDEIEAIREGAANATGVEPVVVLQVLPDDFFAPADLEGLKEAVTRIREAFKELSTVWNREDVKPGSEVVGELVDVLEEMGMTGFTIEWPEPEFDDPMYISLDIHVEDTSTITPQQLNRLVSTLREIAGCNYTLVVGITDLQLTMEQPINGAYHVQDGTPEPATSTDENTRSLGPEEAPADSLEASQASTSLSDGGGPVPLGLAVAIPAGAAALYVASRRLRQ